MPRLTIAGWLAPVCTILLAVSPLTSSAVKADETPASSEGPLLEQQGLAARYRGDRGLRNDPAVVFVDDSETAIGDVVPDGLPVDQGATRRHAWDHAWGGVRITRDAAGVHGGSQAYELSIEGPGARGMSKYFNAGFDRLFLRYYIKYHEAFPGAHHVGGAIQARAPGLPHADPGIKADGTNKFTVLLDHWSFDPSVVPPGHLVAYLYHMDQRHKWGEQFWFIRVLNG
jgi:hypothetical protein